jgi:alanine racemase
MSAKKLSDSLRTWIEIDARAAKKNYNTFRKLVGKKVKLWSVVKSNAYGHGLYAFSALMDEFGIDGFCVDSVVEGLSLRNVGIKKPILVLGQTLPSRYAEAAKNDITISISNFDALEALARAKKIPDFHIKIDTGMHRQGFYLEDVPNVIAQVAKSKGLRPHLKGLFTHFAAAKDMHDHTYADAQLKNFKKTVDLFEKAGFTTLIKHASATGGTLLGAPYHFDSVRVGIGLYGLWPADELKKQLGKKIILHPVLSWRATISEVKNLKKGDYVGYDLTERVKKDVKMAVVPIGYWHGFPRALSSVGAVIVNGKVARVLGRVSMDMIAIALSSSARPGDVVTIIGRDGRAKVSALEQSINSNTSEYEFVTRLNPLMERVIIR